MTDQANIPPRVVVTGASRGIGQDVVRALIRKGCHIVANGRDEEKLVALAEEAPAQVSVAVGDLRDASALTALIPNAVTLLGGIDALINCAGVVEYEAALEITRDAIDKQLQVNFIAPLILSRDAARVMSSGSAIINVASTLAFDTAADTTVYGASKAALIAATKTMAQELAPRGIRVNAIAPGLVDTDMLAGRDIAALSSLHPLGRLGLPSDISSAVCFMLEASWMTGTVLTLDGGLTVA